MTKGGIVDDLSGHRSALVNYVRPLVGDRARAEDVVQDAYLRLTANPDTGGHIRDRVAYLYRMVRNIALDGLRRDRLERREEETPQWWMLPGQGPSPEDAAAHGQLVARIDTVLAQMEPRMRLALELNRFEGYTLQEIAGRLSVSVPTVHRLVRDGLVRISLALRASGDEA